MQTFRVAEHKMFQVDGRELLYLIADSAIFEMDARTKESLNRWIPPQVLREEDIVARLDGSNEEKRAAFTQLLKRRIIVPDNNGTFPQNRANAEHFSIPLKTLVLHLTDACNLGCIYCYHAQKKEGDKKKEWMTPEVAERAVDFLLAHSGNLPAVTLVFFGGEPLLSFNLLSSVVTYAREKAAEKKKKIDFALTTNGTLLTKEVIHFLHDNRVGVTVSVDGFEEAHDRNRCFADGSPSYKLILPGIKNLLREAGGRPVVGRVTLTKDFCDVAQIVDHLLDLGFSEVGVGPVTTKDLSCQLDEARMNLLLQQFNGLAVRFLSAALAGEFYGFSNVIDLLVQLHEGELKSYSCGAGLGLFSVAPDGGLYLCQRFTGEDSFCMGDIVNGFNHERLASFRQKAEIRERGDCRRCWVRNICSGGCYHEAWVREGSHLKPNTHYCAWIKRWVEIGLDLYGRIAFTCPEYLDKLSLSRGHTPTEGYVI